jgi:hypothetical protein
MRKLPYSTELSASGEIFDFAQEEEILSVWQSQQQTASKNMVKMHLIGIVAISNRNFDFVGNREICKDNLTD